MKTLAVAMVIVGGLAAWIPAAGAEEYSKATFGKNVRGEQADTYPADDSDKPARSRKRAAVASEDQADARSDLTITPAQESRESAMANKRLSTNAHNIKTIDANFQALYDGMSDPEKKTAHGVYRRHLSAAK